MLCDRRVFIRYDETADPSKASLRDAYTVEMITQDGLGFVGLLTECN